MKKQSQPKWIKNIMRMFEPDWMKKWSTQKELMPVLAEINRLPEQKLIRAALEARTSEVRLAAVQNPRLMDQRTLEQIVEKETYTAVRKAAIRKLTNQNILLEVAKTELDKDIRFAALERLCENRNPEAVPLLVEAINRYANSRKDTVPAELEELERLLRAHYKDYHGTITLKRRQWHMDYNRDGCYGADRHTDSGVKIDYI